MIVSLILSLVTATGCRMTDGTFFIPLSVVVFTRPAGGFFPWRSATASVAAPGASCLTAL